MKLATFLLATFLASCVQVGPKKIDIPHESAQPAVKCPDPMVPPPIPESVHIVIEPGKPVLVDDGGERLLRAYIAIIDQARKQP